ncbi:MAG: HAMP domain-containing histidine kinase [Bacteroidetes bacterium]|nr:HAMP domain-containing histidine kinase [Bacteroidota bacterium]
MTTESDRDLVLSWQNPIWISLILVLVVVILIVSFLKYIIFPQQMRLFDQSRQIEKLNEDKLGLANKVTELNTHLSVEKSHIQKIEQSYEGLKATTEASSRRLDRALHDFNNFISTPLMAVKFLISKLNPQLKPDKRELITSVDKGLTDLKEYVPLIREEFKSGVKNGKFWLLDDLLPKTHLIEDYLTIEVTGNRFIRVFTHKENFEGLFSNLVSNALRYGATKILVSITDKPNAVYLQMMNNGEPLSSDAVDKLFRIKFTTGGSGHSFTSLTDLKSVHKDHDAFVDPADLPEPYTVCFVLVLPKFQDRDQV